MDVPIHGVRSGGYDKTIRLWKLIWDLEFTDPVVWDESVRPYIEIFLTLLKGKWGEEDFKLLIDELASKRGYGWVRPEGIRKELEKMTKEYKPIQGLLIENQKPFFLHSSFAHLADKGN